MQIIIMQSENHHYRQKTLRNKFHFLNNPQKISITSFTVFYLKKTTVFIISLQIFPLFKINLKQFPYQVIMMLIEYTVQFLEPF